MSIQWLCVTVVTTGLATAEPSKEDLVLYKHPERYSAFPSLTKDPDDRIWVNFGWNTTRSHYGKAAGGETGGIALYSPDAGRTWHRSGEDEQYRGCPEQLRHFVLSDGTMLSVGPRMHEVLPGEKKAELSGRGIAVKEWPDGHISASYRVLMRRKPQGSDSWESRYLELPPFASMGGFGRGCRLADDTVLKPVYGKFAVDDPAVRSWVLRSADGGDSWNLIEIAYDGVHNFNEAELLSLPNGRVLAMIRSESGGPLHETGFLWQTHSDDFGKTWSPAKRTHIWGYPPHLLLTADGDVLCTYGYRRPPFGVRACFSRDAGLTWDTEHEVILRADALPHGRLAGKGSIGDLGYPRSVEFSDGSLMTVYYITLGDGVTHVAATRWSRDYLGPADLPRGAAAVRQPDPSLPAENITGESESVRLMYGLMQSFIPTEGQVGMVAIRVSDRSGGEDLLHTNGLSVAIRKPGKTSWWTEFLGASEVLAPAEVKCGGWNAFRFASPVQVTPGETYVLTVYNKDYLGGGPTRLKDGLSGDHSWYLNYGSSVRDEYPNGGMSLSDQRDLAFKVYAEPGPLPKP